MTPLYDNRADYLRATPHYTMTPQHHDTCTAAVRRTNTQRAVHAALTRTPYRALVAPTTAAASPYPLSTSHQPPAPPHRRTTTTTRRQRCVVYARGHEPVCVVATATTTITPHSVSITLTRPHRPAITVRPYVPTTAERCGLPLSWFREHSIELCTIDNS